MALSPTIQVTVMRHQTEIQEALHKSVKKVADKAIASGTTDLQSYYEQIQYHLGWVDANFTPTTNNPGNLLRPTLLLLAYEVAGAWSLDTSDSAYLHRELPAAEASEHSTNLCVIKCDSEDSDPHR